MVPPIGAEKFVPPTATPAVMADAAMITADLDKLYMGPSSDSPIDDTQVSLSVEQTIPAQSAMPVTSSMPDLQTTTRSESSGRKVTTNRRRSMRVSQISNVVAQPKVAATLSTSETKRFNISPAFEATMECKEMHGEPWTRELSDSIDTPIAMALPIQDDALTVVQASVPSDGQLHLPVASTLTLLPKLHQLE